MSELNASSEPRYKQPQVAVPQADAIRNQTGVWNGAGMIFRRCLWSGRLPSRDIAQARRDCRVWMDLYFVSMVKRLNKEQIYRTAPEVVTRTGTQNPTAADVEPVTV